MRLIVRVAGLAAMLCLALPFSFAKTPPVSKNSEGTIVIVFKDGHRQSFNLSEIERVEFPMASGAASAPAPANSSFPSRNHYLGKWEVGDGSGGRFFITLFDDGEARRSSGNEHGKWVYVDGEARVSWDDGWQDAIRKVGSSFHKFAYRASKSFTDKPDNVDDAHNTTPHPI